MEAEKTELGALYTTKKGRRILYKESNGYTGSVPLIKRESAEQVLLVDEQTFEWTGRRRRGERVYSNPRVVHGSLASMA